MPPPDRHALTARPREAVVVPTGRPCRLVVARGPLAVWSALRADEGDRVTLRASSLDVADGAAVTFVVLARRPEGQDEQVGALEGTAQGGAASAEWEVRRRGEHDDPLHYLLLEDDEPARPSWRFRVLDGDRELACSGLEPDRLLVFQRRLDLILRGPRGEAIPDAPYRICYHAGGTAEGTSDAAGRVYVEDATPGSFHIKASPAPERGRRDQAGRSVLRRMGI